MNIWRQVRLGEVTESMKNGIYKPASAYADDGYACLRMYNIDDGKLVWRDIKRMRLHKEELTEYRLVPGDLLVNRVNSRELVGKAAVIPEGVEPLVFESKNIRLRLQRDRADPKWINYQLLLYGRRHFAANAQQVVGMASVNQKQLADFAIVLPPLEIQQAAVAEIEKQFSRLDEAVASLKRTKANLKRYKAAVLKAAVEGRINTTGSERWARTNLDAVLIAIEAGKSFKCEERTPSHHEIGVVKVSAVTWGTYNEEESKTCHDSSRIDQRYFVRAGDFLFSRANTIELVGACVIAQKVTRKIMLSDKILRFRFSDEVLPEWVLYWLRSDVGRKEIQRLSTGNQESMRNIGQDRIRQIGFALPTLDKQREIVDEVERRLSVTEELEATIETNLTRADRLRQSILERAFSGALLQ